MESIRKYSTIIIIAILLVVIFFLKECNGRGGSIHTDPSIIKTDTVIVVQVDTITHRDTVWEERIVYLPSKPVPTPVVNIEDTTQLTYSDSTSTDDITLFYSATVRGELLSIDHNYRLKIPKEITEIKEITKTIDKTITITKFKGGFYLGGGINYNVKDNNPSIMLGAAYASKKGGLYGYDYDPINNIHQLSFKMRVFPLKKSK